jgi:hypothetical protein
MCASKRSATPYRQHELISGEPKTSGSQRALRVLAFVDLASLPAVNRQPSHAWGGIFP